MDPTLELIKTSRGGDKLCLDGHMYTVKVKQKASIRWACYKARSLSCKGAVSTDMDVSMNII